MRLALGVGVVISAMGSCAPNTQTSQSVIGKTPIERAGDDGHIAKSPGPVALWQQGRPEEAVAALVVWATSDESDLLPLTDGIDEEAFASLPREKRELKMQQLLDENHALREFVASAIQQSRDAALAGDTERASQILAALHVLARVQQRPTLSRQTIMTGEGIEQATQREQQLLSNQGPG